MTPVSIRRPERPDDAAFRFALFRASRPPAERLEGLPPDLADRLFRHQFDGQAASYRAAHPAARHDIVEVDGLPVGRIVTELTATVLTLVDIALVEAWRGRGLGTRLVAAMIEEARDAAVPMRLRVMAGNADAMRLYARLGFVVVEAGAVDVAMELAPDAVTPAARVPDRLRLPLVFDAAAMAAEVAALAHGDWIAHFVPRNYEGDWSVIPLRGKAGATHPILSIASDPTCDYADTPFLAACPAIRAALTAFQCPLQAVRLMRLGPGAIIKEHRDPDLAFEDGCVRLHVPIVTNADVEFHLAGRRVAMAPGEAWYLRLTEPHGVANRGATARVHLVIDARADDWLATLLAASEEISEEPASA